MKYTIVFSGSVDFEVPDDHGPEEVPSYAQEWIEYGFESIQDASNHSGLHLVINEVSLAEED